MLYKFCKYWLISTSNYLKRYFFNLIIKYQGIFKSQDVESNKILWSSVVHCIEKPKGSCWVRFQTDRAIFSKFCSQHFYIHLL